MKILKFIILLVLIGVIALLLILFSGKDYEKDGHYYSPLGKFYFPIPKGLGGLRMTQGTQSVSFTNDWCELYRIDYSFIPEQAYQESKQVPRNVFLEHALRNVYIRSFLQPNLPEAVISVDHVEFMGNVFNGSLYAQLDVPKGSVCEMRYDGGAPVREDAKRGVLVVMYGDRLYIITTALSIVDTGAEALEASSGLGKKMWDDTQSQKLMMKTLEFGRTFRFQVSESEHEEAQNLNKVIDLGKGSP